MTAILQNHSTNGNDASRAIEFELQVTCRHDACAHPWSTYGFVGEQIVSAPAEVAKGWPAQFFGARIPDGVLPWYARSMTLVDGTLTAGPWGPPLPISVPEPGLVGLLAGLVLLTALGKWCRF